MNDLSTKMSHTHFNCVIGISVTVEVQEHVEIFVWCLIRQAPKTRHIGAKILFAVHLNKLRIAAQKTPTEK